jgi:hypothetical protein
VKRHPFYADLLEAQGDPGAVYHQLLASQAHPAWLQAARADARRMHVGWAIAWSHTPEILNYLRAVGFRFGYAAGGALVYRLGPRS